MIKSDGGQPVHNDFESCALLCDEKNFLSVGGKGSDQVGDCLALPSARRTVHDRALPGTDTRDCALLAGVRFYNGELAVRRDCVKARWVRFYLNAA